MKKEDLLAKLGSLENAEEIAEYILAENAKEVEQATKGNGTSEELTATKTALEKANKDLEEAKTELGKYAKDGEKYIDPEEFKRLKAFETDTVSKAEAKKRSDALNALFDTHGVPQKVRKLLAKAVGDDGVKLNEDGKIADGDKLIATLKEEYSEAFESDGNKGRAGLDGKGNAPQGGSFDDLLNIR